MNNQRIKGNILIIDDFLPNLRLLTGMLADMGYKVRGAPNGKVGVKAARLAPPDLILLDIMMPDEDGYTVCARLKKFPETHNIPVIFISALDAKLDKVKAFSVGGVDYITKPFQAEEVVARVENHLMLHNMQKQLQEMNQELLGANQALRQSNDELDAFARTVAHDLNNPIGVIMANGEMLEMGILPPEKEKAAVNTIIQTSLKMRDIVNELMLLSGVRKAEVTPEPLDMAEIVTAALERLSTMIEAYQARIDLPEAWPTAMGYAPWIEEVWVNYISNGLKYGGRPPHLQLGASTQAGSLTQFRITDNGAGLTKEEQSQLFIPFNRLTDLKIEGHGLGLSIVVRIMRKLEGEAGVVSTPGEGSTFSFSLPPYISDSNKNAQ
jgi:two-component system sensor histidine kinase/response regulator